MSQEQHEPCKCCQAILDNIEQLHNLELLDSIGLDFDISKFKEKENTLQCQDYGHVVSIEEIEKRISTSNE